MAELIKKYIHFIKRQFRGVQRAHGTKSGTSYRSGLPGPNFRVRPAVFSDAPDLYRMHLRLSNEAIYYRYLMLHKPTFKEMRMVCSMSGNEGAALVCEAGEPGRTIVGMAFYRKAPAGEMPSPEFAIVVEDCFQGRGVGKLLLAELVKRAMIDGHEALSGSIHPENFKMRRLLQGIGHPVCEFVEDGLVKAQIRLTQRTQTAPPSFLFRARLSDPFAGLDLGIQ